MGGQRLRVVDEDGDYYEIDEDPRELLAAVKELRASANGLIERGRQEAAAETNACLFEGVYAAYRVWNEKVASEASAEILAEKRGLVIGCALSAAMIELKPVYPSGVPLKDIHQRAQEIINRAADRHKLRTEAEG